MSRSYRKTPVFPICCIRSQKWWKRSYNRIYRRHGNVQLQRYLGNDDVDYEIGQVYKQSYADIWASPSDGKWRVEMLRYNEFLQRDNLVAYHGSYENYVIDYKRLYLSK